MITPLVEMTLRLAESDPTSTNWTLWLRNLSAGVGIVGTTLALIVAARLWFPVPRVARLRSRMLRVGDPSQRSWSVIQNKMRIERFLSKNERSVTHELTWLNEVYGGGPRSTLLDRLDHREIESLSRRYADVAGQMFRSNVLDPSRHLMKEMADLHHETAVELAAVANSSPIEGVDRFEPRSRSGASSLRTLTLPAKNLVLELFAYPGLIEGHLVFDCLAHVGENEATGTWPPRRGETYGDHEFDGVLPALNSASLQKDLRTGRVRLTMSLSAVRYSDVMRDHFYAQGQHDAIQSAVDPRSRISKPRDQRNPTKGTIAGTEVGLLTCSFMPVTADGYLILVERGRSAGAHAGDVGAAVTGNLELAPREGRWVDRRPSGCPDFRMAMQREAREELGLDVPLESIFINALGRFTSTSEINTNVVCATAILDRTLDEVAECIRYADLGEGRWEVGGRLVGLKLPGITADASDPSSAYAARLRDIMGWLLTTADLPPHAAINGWASMATVLNNPSIFTEYLDEVIAANGDVTNRAVESSAPFVKVIPFDLGWAEVEPS